MDTQASHESAYISLLRSSQASSVDEQPQISTSVAKSKVEDDLNSTCFRPPNEKGAVTVGLLIIVYKDGWSRYQIIEGQSIR
ncbi:hypothetical protein OS493_017951 [Desmophyllum pertusum]|uniref:Uncharacterized protein n=1 Tax=Desmophyllum pertusum TaxID=174260 RepID=A0A9W9YZU5_9CNID|nr:hypothetical protein OS493_017951 [Desmophyllum pertusum]